VRVVNSLTLVHATLAGNAGAAGGAGGAGQSGPGGPGVGGGDDGGGGGATQGTAGAAGNGGISVTGTATLKNSIVSGNGLPSCAGSAVGDGGHNVVFPDASCPGTVVDPGLAALADNGGPTRTQALSGAAAVDVVPSAGAGCEATDQRGVVRPRGPACDAGAYERALPDVTTGGLAGVTTTSATVGGRMTPYGAGSYHFDYGTTTAYGASTPAQSAAGLSGVDASAALAGLAPATTYHYRLVGTNQDGTASGDDATFTTPAAAGPPGSAPRFLAASLKPATFAVDPKGRSEVAVSAHAAKKKKAKKGTTIRFTLSEAARVVVTIKRRSRGRKVGKRCVKPTRATRRKHACARYTRAARFAVTATAGANKRRFSGRVGRKSLKPGRYRLTLVATDKAGKRSAPRQLGFKIVRG
jgi:hypothetical protein